jgi:branched-chain amino acid transport system ATP-binding protein
MAAFLQLDRVTLDYGAVRAVDHVELDVAGGEICALVGPNGSGKSSLLNTISGFSVLTDGRIHLGGDDVSSAPSYDLARRGIARTFQLVRVLHGLTVQENVAAGCYAATRRSGLRHVMASMASPRRYTGEMQATVEEAMERAKISHLADELVDGLPFGTQRRVEVARALATKPKLLLFDEPAAGLSERDLDDLERLIQEEAARGCAVILVDHHLHFVLKVCPRVVVLNFGRLIFDGPSAAAIEDQQVREAYVGS